MAIPKSMLPHTVTVETPTGYDDWQKPTYSNGVMVKYVKIDPARALKTDNQNRQMQLSATLFFDFRNSMPLIKFSVGQRVTFKGHVYKVEIIETLFDNLDRPHHYEIGLS